MDGKARATVNANAEHGAAAACRHLPHVQRPLDSKERERRGTTRWCCVGGPAGGLSHHRFTTSAGHCRERDRKPLPAARPSPPDGGDRPVSSRRVYRTRVKRRCYSSLLWSPAAARCTGNSSSNSKMAAGR
ncbi:hypothetical protein QLX08_011167 [Tetragonisca angustula]|uniref:Uncharacterized protein n=1 Tax=Tetragonisca angustula TaxID=166442 RepID=A0AAW0Z9G5_9HYME